MQKYFLLLIGVAWVKSEQSSFCLGGDLLQTS